MKSVFVKINPVGQDVGDHFIITADVGITSPTSATKAQLLIGIMVSVDDFATAVTLTCTSILCPDKDIVLIINATTTTTTTVTTTTTTTAATTTTTTTAIGPTTTTTTTCGAGPYFYDCGYGCMEYPNCQPCDTCYPFPTTTTTTTIGLCELICIIDCFSQTGITTTTTTTLPTTTTTTTSSPTTTTTSSPTTTTTTSVGITTTTTTTISNCMFCNEWNSFAQTYYSIGSAHNPGVYIIGNSTTTEPSYLFYFNNGNSIYTLNPNMQNIDYNVWFTISNVIHGPYVYRWNIAGTGAFDVPAGKFNTNVSTINYINSTQFSTIDKNGNDLTSLLSTFDSGSVVYFSNCYTPNVTTTTTTTAPTTTTTTSVLTTTTTTYIGPITTTTTTTYTGPTTTTTTTAATTTTTTTAEVTTTTTTEIPQFRIANVNTNCNNSTINITVINGVAPYYYSVDNGKTLVQSNSKTYNFTNLTGGVYDIYVKDSSGYFYLYKEQNCNQITVIFETVYLTSYSTGYIYDENSTPYTTSFSVTRNPGTIYNTSSLSTNSSTFLGWSFAINGSKPSKSQIGNVNYLSKTNNYQHTFNYNTTVYAIFDKSGPKYLDFCYFSTSSGYIATDTDLAYYCPNCTQTIRVYYNENQYNTIGYEKITWYKDVNLTILVDPGYYKLVGATKTTIYRLQNGLAVYGGSCPNEPRLSCC